MSVIVGVQDSSSAMKRFLSNYDSISKGGNREREIKFNTVDLLKQICDKIKVCNITGDGITAFNCVRYGGKLVPKCRITRI